jgi:hypothetical protein
MSKPLRVNKPPPIGRGDILKIAALAELDPRTVKRALDRGINSLRAEVDRARIRNAAQELGLTIE